MDNALYFHSLQFRGYILLGIRFVIKFEFSYFNINSEELRRILSSNHKRFCGVQVGMRTSSLVMNQFGHYFEQIH